ncbi:MAG: DEAD/DEAH box helicase, partial [Bdellovibrionales bacterium]|nr:DEAD/DEAH box helicase [Bdellovibrionales bacterium]
MERSKFLLEARERFLRGIGIPKKEEFRADPFQLESISLVSNGNDTLVVAPTGSGKTHIAIECIRSYLQMGQRAVYTTPLKALSNTKFNELRKIFEPDFSVGLLTGDRKIETEASVVIATTEIYRNELYKQQDRYSLVVLDEVHFIADSQRGAVWEESIILTPQDSTLLMLSASISNPDEIAEWLYEVRGKECRVIVETKRPVELRFGFLHPQFGVIPLQDDKGRILREVRDFYASPKQERDSRRGGRNSSRNDGFHGARKG